MPSEGILKTPKGQIAVATTVMLTFISFWRAAAIVLNDMASTAYYIGGIAEQAIGKGAPWFVLGIMLFSYVIRMVYLESTILFSRGGLYTVVKATLGSSLAKLAISALVFDFLLTGPISAVAAGQYIIHLFNQIAGHFAVQPFSQNLGAVLLACIIIAYFWRQNIRGIHESSTKALRIMQITAVMVLLLLGWSAYTLWLTPWTLPPMTTELQPHALGWLKDYAFPFQIPAVAIAIGLGHSLLAMSGEETFAQVGREIAHPKLKNLKKAAMLMFVFCFIFTTSVCFLGIMLIPDAIRPQYYDNLILGVVFYLIGPLALKLFFQGFVVVVGFLILSGACNTALIGSNAVLNRLSEDGVLPNWFRKPHHHFGTSYRILNVVALLQIITILISRGDVYLLGEAYAFGVLWSFVFQTLSVFVLRFKNPAPREWKFPLNLHLGKLELPIGLFLTLIALLVLATANLFTKQVATIAGTSFTLLLFTIFSLSELWRKTKSKQAVGLDPFQVVANPQITRANVGCRPHNILVPVIESKDLSHLDAILRETDTQTRDIVVMTTQLLKRSAFGWEEEEHMEVFDDQTQDLFTRTVKLAEKHGKTIKLVVAGSNDTYFSIAQTAYKIDSESVVLRVSATLTAQQQAKAMSDAWDKLPNPTKKDILVKIWRDGKTILEWHALPPPPDIPRETLRTINYLYREMNPEGVEKVSRARIIEMAVEKLLKEHEQGNKPSS